MNAESCEVTLCAPADYPRLSGADITVEPMRTWYAQMLAGTRLVFICAEDGAWRGEVALVLAHPDPEYTIPGQRAYLSRLVVAPEHRRRGIGGRLVEHLAAYARRLGLRELALGVNCDNAAALRLYEQHGFTHVIRQAEDADGAYLKLLRVL